MDKEPPVAGDARFRVGEMFGRIARTYDLLNHVLSFGRDFAWRRKVAGLIGDGRGLKVADLATGTGDLLIALLRRRPDLTGAVGLDISEPMLEVFREKLRRAGLSNRVELLCADASTTPFAAGAFDAVTMGFGIRNTPDVRATLREIHRILKPGGVVLILEFSLPKNRVIRWCHLKYLRYAVPVIGAVISGDRQAYRYLNQSLEAFHSPGGFGALMREVGFTQVQATPVTWGVASIYQGQKPCV
ncbi:MAG: bifunctional demethylmenaquinone methyltransferase/2-methoxy-6-polyprenyl-1,4-benzoquinol methylase UbiE [Phycisphaerales bacterium]